MTAEERIHDFLLSCHRIFYLGTCENGVPDLRPFGAVILYDGHAMFCTGEDKNVYRQMQENPNVSICACWKGTKWMRVSGRAVFVEDEGAKQAMLGLEERLKKRYGENGEKLKLFRLTDGKVRFCERGVPEEVLEF